jgi:phage baseplate assembly protein W
MRPSFGVDSWSFVFENNDDVLAAVIRQQVRDAIQLHEPRVRIEAIRVVAEDELVTTEIIFQWQGRAGSVDVEFPRNGNGI